jgi:type I restriction-modification system DNA methylase subunit
MSTQISKEDLLNFTHQLHNKLRGAKGIKLTGLPALNEIENILFFRFMEEIDEIKDIDEDITFTAICEKYATDEKIKEDKKIPHIADRNCYKLWDEFYNTSNTKCIIGKYFSNETIKKYINSAVTRISAFTDKNRGGEISPTIQVMFNMVYNKFKIIKFDSKFYDMFGSAHEEFKTNEHGNGGKGTGQHFTPMDIKQYVAEELDVKSNETYYEPCAGTGGFIHTIDKHVREKEGEKASKKFKNNIYANECNPELVKPLMINMLLHNIPVTNIHEQDSLSNKNCEFMKNKVDVIGTNYPFGMSNTIDLSDYTDKDYWKILLRGKNVIKNSTGQFIIHILNTLKKNGRAGFVSDRGILNNGDKSTWEGEIRKFMVTNSNVYKIVLLPKGIFPYTPFATCVIFIKKGEKTENVKIYESKFKDEKNRKGLIIDTEPIKTFSIKELEKNGYSFKLEEKVEKIQTGWVKLGDVVEIKRGKSLSKNNIIEGKYPVISGCSEIKNYHNETNINGDNYIFMARVGSAGNILLCKGECYLTDLAFGLECNNKYIYNKMYLYYYFIFNYNQIKEIIQTNGPPNINGSYLSNIQIPSLSLSHQKEIVEFLDKQFELYDINLLAKQIKDMPLFNLLIDKQYETFSDALHLIYRKMELDALHTKMEKDKKAVFNIRVGGLDCKEYKLGDIVEIKNFTPSKIEKANENGKYPFYNCSILGHLWTNEYVYEDEVLIMTRINGSGKYKVYYNNGKFNIGTNLLIFKTNKKCNIKFLMKYLNYNTSYYETFFEGSDKKFLNQKLFVNSNINIPSLQDQEKIIKDIEKIESEQSSYKKYGDMLQEQIDSISKLIENLAKNNKEESDSNSESESDNSSSSESESEDEKPKKKVVKKPVKKTTSKKKVESSSESESDSEESEDEKPKKKIKKLVPKAPTKVKK